MSTIDTLLNQLRYTNRARVKTDIDKLAKEYKTLIPRAVDYVHDNGTQSRLIVLSGTVPIYYNSVQYNIPVDVFLMISYPLEAPKLYVRPTPNMTVKANHRHVSPDGLCYLPYLAEWSLNSHLNGLIEITSSVFSIEPPLFSKPPGGAAASSPSPVRSTVASPPVSIQRPAYGGYGQAQPAAVVQPTSSSSSSAYNPAASNNNNISSYESYASPASTASVYSPTSTTNAAAATSFYGQQQQSEADKKAQLIDQVSMRMYEEIDRKQRKLRDELDTEMTLSITLSESGDTAARVLRDLQSANTHYTEALARLTAQSSEFEAWSADLASQAALTAADRLVPYDALSAQIVRLHAEINAIDDAFYHMERALVSSKNETVDLSTFLKECRQLARTQFLSKAHLKKISAVCLQQQAEHEATQARAQASLPHTEYAQQQFTPPAALSPHSQPSQAHQAQQAQAWPQAPHTAVHVTGGPPLVPSYSRYDGLSAVPYPGAGNSAGRY